MCGACVTADLGPQQVGEHGAPVVADEVHLDETTQGPVCQCSRFQVSSAPETAHEVGLNPIWKDLFHSCRSVQNLDSACAGWGGGQ